ncbi:hypothetical protein [Schlesneria paludicola]|uniref:hypothetical protein n=1 Tax=Schlesneria paludicola TaxID=360056 RepID=UPI000492306A|nr:hypothetical protein [Schlesneria paludicola]
MDSSQTTSANRPILPPLQASPDSIQLDIFLLERPADDHLLCREVWKDVDEIGAIPDSELRGSLRTNGFQVGVVPSNPPPSIQKLLGMRAEISSEVSDDSKPLMGNHHFLSPGGQLEVETGITHQQCRFTVREKGRIKTLDFERARGVMRVRATRLQEGWVRVDFQPEIHHGEPGMMRYAALEREFGYRGGQNIDVRHALKFSVNMNLGNLTLISCTSDDQDTVGDCFFGYTEQSTKKQRVLVVRAVDSSSLRQSHGR